MKSRNNFKKRLISVAVASVLTGLGSHAAANDFTIANGALNISNGTFNQAVTVGVNGIVPAVIGVPLENSFGIPNFTFSLLNQATTKTPGTYQFKVGVAIDDDRSDRRIEAFLGNLRMEVTNNGNTLTGSIPSQNLVVIGRDTATNVTRLLNNASTNGPISISGNGVSFNGATLVSRLKGSNPIFDAIFDSFNTNPGHYTYSVVIEQVSAPLNAPATRFGLMDGGVFSPLPQARTTCAGTPGGSLAGLFQLLGTVNNAAYRVNEQFTAAYAVQGQFSVVNAQGAAAAAPTAINCATPTITPGGSNSTNVNTAVSGTLPAASDGDGTVPTYQIVSTSSGTFDLTNARTGAFTYTPANNFAGTATVRFRVTDGTNTSAEQDYVITVNSPNTAPTANLGITGSTTFNGTTTIQLAGTDSDPNTALTYSIASGPSKGTASVNASTGVVTYTHVPTPGQGAADTDSFTFNVSDGTDGSVEPATVNITIAANRNPVTTDVVIDTPIQRGSTFSGTLTATDPDGNPLTFAASGNQSAGVSFALSSNGQYEFTASQIPFVLVQPTSLGANFTVTDQFGGTSTSSITFSNITNAPVTNRPPVIVETPALSTKFRVPVSGQIATPTDDDGDTAFTFAITGQPDSGSVELLNATTGEFRYTPAADTTGTLSFSYSVSDGKPGGLANGSVTVNVGQRVDPTVSVSVPGASFVDRNGIPGEQAVPGITGSATVDTTIDTFEWTVNGALVAAGSGTVTVPTFNFATDGDKVIALKVKDSVGLEGTASATIRILAPVNPLASIPSGGIKVVDRVAPGNPLGFETVTITGLASDADSPNQQVTKVEWLLNNAVVLEGGPQALTTPLTIPVGATNTVTLRVTDSQNLTATASINVEVVAPKAPVVTGLSGLTSKTDSDGLPGEDITFTATATDDDGQVVSYEWFVNGGQVSGQTAATATLRIPDEVGGQPATVTAVAVDNDALKSATSQPLTVSVKANQAPRITIVGEAINETVGTTEVLSRSLTANAFDPDSTVAPTVAWTVDGNNVTVSQTGALTITPPAVATVTATATDNRGATSTATFPVNVQLLNIPVISALPGPFSIDDTDAIPGVSLPVSATVTASQGGDVTGAWTVDGEAAGTGLQTTLPLAVGPNTVRFTATATNTAGTVTTRFVEAVYTVKSAAPNVVPTITIAGPSLVTDKDGKNGELVTFTAVAVDPDLNGPATVAANAGAPQLITWTVDGSPVEQTGASVTLQLANGERSVQARAIDKLGGVGVSNTVNVDVRGPTGPADFTVSPTVIIDTDGKAGDLAVLSVDGIAAKDALGGDNTVQWSVGGAVFTGLTASVVLPADDNNTVSVTVRDSLNLSRTKDFVIDVKAPISPTASIVGLPAGGIFPDVNNAPGETVVLFGQASDEDGPGKAVKATQWLVNGTPVSTGPEFSQFLQDSPDGPTSYTITFVATDFQGLQSPPATVQVTLPAFVPPPSTNELNQRTATLGGLSVASRDEAAPVARLAAEQSEQLRRSAEAGSASTEAITRGLGAVAVVARRSAQGGGANNAEVNSQASLAVANGGRMLNQLANNNVSLTREEEEQVRQATTELLNTTAQVARNTTNTDDLLNLVRQQNEITEANKRLGVAALPAQAAATATASLEIATQVAQQALRELGVSGLNDDDVRAALRANPNALNNVISASLKIPSTNARPANENLSTSLRQAAELSNDVSGTLVNGVSAQDAIIALFGGGVAGQEAFTVTVVDASGRIASVSQVEANTATIKVDPITSQVVISLPGEAYSGTVVGIRAVPATVPTGVRFNADGTGVIINGGFAVEIAPAPIDLVKFATTVESAGFPFRMNPNATITLQVGNGERFSGAFAYDNLTGIDLAACGDLSFIEPTGALNSAGYAFGVRCANGAVQRVVPFIESATFVDSVRAFGLTPSTDRNTGFVTIPTVGVFKPNFFVLPTTPADRVFHAANKDAFGNAVQYLDANGDGKLDVRLITATGTQLLFGVN